MPIPIGDSGEKCRSRSRSSASRQKRSMQAAGPPVSAVGKRVLPRMSMSPEGVSHPSTAAHLVPPMSNPSRRRSDFMVRNFPVFIFLSVRSGCSGDPAGNVVPDGRECNRRTERFRWDGDGGRKVAEIPSKKKGWTPSWERLRSSPDFPEKGRSDFFPKKRLRNFTFPL